MDSLNRIIKEMEVAAMDVAEGAADPLEVYAALQVIKKRAEEMEGAVKAEALESAKTYGVEKGSVAYKGFTLKFVSSRCTYKYDHIGTWAEIDKRKKLIEELAKLAAKNGCDMADPETGEVILPAHASYSKEGLSVSLS